MGKSRPHLLGSLLEAPAVREAARALIEAVAAEAEERGLAPGAYERAIKQLGRARGRPLPFPMMMGAPARGARVRLADGSWKLDFIGGIGVYGFGHGDPDLLETAVTAAACDAVFQGHLMPGPEYLKLSKALLRHAGPRLKHAWLSVSGAMANENALKLVFQKHQPADHIVLFEHAFTGRTLAMAELTDKPGFREGLPLRGSALYVPFFDARDPEESTARSLEALDDHLARYRGRIAAMMFELVQGEGGIRTAPRAFFATLMERCRDAGIAVWVDEVQTFARTGELFAFQTLDLAEYVDVVTAGKMLQGSAVLFTRTYNPKPGLIAGTYAGSTVGMAVGERIIQKLEDEGYLGPDGRVALLGRRIERRFESLCKRMPRAATQGTGIGAMFAFQLFDGTPAAANAVLRAAFEEGLLLFSAGEDPTKIRMLPPVNTTDEEIETAFTLLEKAMVRVAEESGLSC
jgi:4-aminobutyrate aminotransferase-like enzyme